MKPRYPMRGPTGLDTNAAGLAAQLGPKSSETPGVVALVTDEFRSERVWLVDPYTEANATRLAAIRRSDSWEWAVGSASGRSPDLLRAILHAEAEVGVGDIDRQAEGLAPAPTGPLYLLAGELIRRAIGADDQLRRRIMLPADGAAEEPRVRTARWARAVADWPADGVFLDEAGELRHPLDVLYERSTRGVEDAWCELALAIVHAAQPESADVEGDATPAALGRELRWRSHPAAVWERVEARLAEYLPCALTIRGLP